MKTKSQAKIPHVSFYRNGKTNRWEVAYSLNRVRRIERLGFQEGPARQRAMEISGLIDKHKSRQLSPVELARMVKDRLPLEKHFEKFDAHLKEKKVNSRYRSMTLTRARKVAELASAKILDHLSAQAIERAIPLIQDLDGRRDMKASGETVRQYLRAMRQFLNWCIRPAGVLAENPMVNVAVPAGGEIRHRRRVPTNEELRLLLTWVEQQKAHHPGATAGADRAMFYRLLLATGLRVSELRAITRSMLKLVEERIVAIELPAEWTKNKKPALQPLPAWLADKLQDWIDGRDGLLFKAFSDLKHTFERDLRRARHAWINEKNLPAEEKKRREESHLLLRRTDAGVWDLHSFRHLYVTKLVGAGVTVKDAQTLARHSSPELTIGIYAHASDELRERVEKAIEAV